VGPSFQGRGVFHLAEFPFTTLPSYLAIVSAPFKAEQYVGKATSHPSKMFGPGKPASLRGGNRYLGSRKRIPSMSESASSVSGAARTSVLIFALVAALFAASCGSSAPLAITLVSSAGQSLAAGT
jgi:hypothetical protein